MATLEVEKHSVTSQREFRRHHSGSSQVFLNLSVSGRTSLVCHTYIHYGEILFKIHLVCKSQRVETTIKNAGIAPGNGARVLATGPIKNGSRGAKMCM